MRRRLAYAGSRLKGTEPTVGNPGGLPLRPAPRVKRGLDTLASTSVGTPGSMNGWYQVPMSKSIPRFGLALLCLCVLIGAEAGAAPRHRSTRILSPLARGVADFDTLLIRTRWDSAGYDVSADFDRLDRGAGAATVTDSAAGVYLIRYVTGAMSGLADSAGIEIPITATSRFDPASTFTYTRLTVCRNWSAQRPEETSSWTRDNRRLFYLGDSLVVTTIWRAEGVRGLQVSADYRSIAPGFQERDLSVKPIGADGAGADTFRIAYQIPAKEGVSGAANDIPITIIGRDSLCSEVLYEELRIDLRSAGPPSPISQRVTSPVDRGIREGDLLEIESRWDSAGYFLHADLAGLDQGAGGMAAVTDAGGGVYSIRYQVGSLAGLPDGAVEVPITAVNRLGDPFTDRSLRVCRNLTTPPPIHVSSSIRNGRTRYHIGDSLVVYTRWRSPSGLALTVEADCRAFVPASLSTDATVTEIAPDSFEVIYRLPSDKNLFSPDGTDIPVIIVGRDLLCSTVRDSTIRIQIDNTGPSAPPRMDALPAEWNSPTLTITGGTVDAALVVVMLNRQQRFTTPVDGETGRFSIEVTLTPGTNEISGWAEDDLGNKSFSGSTETVVYVTGRSLTYPTPFRPRDEFVVTDEAGLRDVGLHIFNLEGDEIVELHQAGPFLETRFAWDGRNRDGELAQPGYYLIRARSVGNDGRSREEVLPLLFQNDE
jgi:hypothetical protein